MTTAALDKRAYTGAPQGYRKSSFPNGEPISHPSEWDREHWSFNNDLKTKAKRCSRPMTTNEALNLIKSMMSSTESVGK